MIQQKKEKRNDKRRESKSNGERINGKATEKIKVQYFEL